LNNEKYKNREAHQEYKSKKLAESSFTNVKIEKINNLNNYDFLNPFETKEEKNNSKNNQNLKPEEQHMNKRRETFESTKYAKYIDQAEDNKIDSLDKAYELFDIKKDIDSNNDLLESIDNQAMENLKESLRGSEIRLSAFLNKEFNTLNMKMIKCCIFCYERVNVFLINL
jgi:hypothetical protein